MSERRYRIAVIGGDGIGPEVLREGLKVLSSASSRFGFSVETEEFDFTGDRYLKTGQLVSDEDIEVLRTYDAIYLGAVGHPDVKPGILEHGVLLKLRFSLDLYVNLRPVKLFYGVESPIRGKGPEDIDFVVVRENTEGLYAGAGGFLHKGTPDEVAIQTAIYTRKGTERIIRFAFEYALQRRRRKKRTPKVTLCDKANVLTYGHDLWRRVYEEVASKFPQVDKDYAFVDAVTMWMVKNPEWFDVIVTTNMFGDIITDLGAMIQGGLGTAASGNIHPGKTSMFEPVHGSAPKYAGKNMANPIAAILAGAMMLEFLGEREAAEKIEDAVEYGLKEGLIKGLSAGVQPTSEIGDIVARLVEQI